MKRLHAALGPVVWGRIHALIYPTVVAVYVHDLMARRFNRAETLVIGLVIVLLVGLRLRRRWLRRTAGVVRAPVRA